MKNSWSTTVGLQLYSKEKPAQVFSREFGQIFWSSIGKYFGKNFGKH